jgi:hypothetical protein
MGGKKTENLRTVACLEFGGTQCKTRVSVPTDAHKNVVISEITLYAKVITDVFRGIRDFAPGD